MVSNIAKEIFIYWPDEINAPTTKLNISWNSWKHIKLRLQSSSLIFFTVKLLQCFHVTVHGGMVRFKRFFDLNLITHCRHFSPTPWPSPYVIISHLKVYASSLSFPVSISSWFWPSGSSFLSCDRIHIVWKWSVRIFLCRTCILAVAIFHSVHLGFRPCFCVLSNFINAETTRRK